MDEAGRSGVRAFEGNLEEAVRKASGRLVLIETSSLPKYELTRRFYLKHGYAQIAAVTNYYAEGDDMLFFGKRMS